MTSYYRNPEPFEESQSSVPNAPASPDDLRTFYRDMEKKEKELALERKASKRRSHSIFTRKSVKRASAVPSDPNQHRPPHRPTSEKSVNPEDNAGEMEKLELREKSDLISGLPSPNLRSIVPDMLKELPAWYNKEDWSPSTSYRTKYPLHNPVGPRYYRNHHLIPPSEYRPSARPPSVFSPSFPAMASSMDRSEEVTRLPGPSRTPSNSPLPTPTSSQTRVADSGIKPRSRKTSQTDGVDLMDVTDPWGANWHHQSPYDVGIGHSPTAEGHEPNNAYARSRRSSMTTRGNKRGTVTPSPLSQSMSAIHLQTSELEGSARLPRKLSKRRAPIFGGWFHGQPTKGPDTASLPAHDYSSSPSPLHETRPASAIPTSKSERRGSVLGRLAKRFSVVRKPRPATVPLPTSEATPINRQPSPEKQKRVPPPSVDESLQSLQPPPHVEPEPDRRSSLSVEAPYTIGKLMVANPDAPASEAGTPLHGSMPLPANDSPPRQTWNAEIPQNAPSIHVPSSPIPIPHSPVPSPSLASPLTGRLSLETSPTITQPRRSLDDKPLPRPVVERKPVEKNTAVSAVPPTKRPSPERGPPPPSTTTKPIALPHVSDHAPPPPSATTKPIALPEVSNLPPPPSKHIPLPTTAPPPPSSTTKPISLPDEPPIPPSSTTKPIPLPSSSLPVPFSIHETASRHSHLSVSEDAMDYSPLSAASILANPPTPHRADDIPMPSDSSPPLPQSQSQPQPPTLNHMPSNSNHSKRGSSREGRRSSRDPSPGISSVTGRETETFKLVRSRSGNVYASNETIRAQGEQWEVVENVQEKDGKSKKRSSSSMSHNKDRESRGREGREGRERRESKRQEKEREGDKEESEQPTTKRSSRSSKKHRSIEGRGQSASQSDSPAEGGNKEETRSSKGRRSHDDDSYREREREHRERRSSRRTTQSASPDKKQAQAQAAARVSVTYPPTPVESIAVSRPNLDRHPSSSARPTSEVPLVADLNAMRAKEAWEMERLYKAKSLYGVDPDANGAAVLPPPSMPGTGVGVSMSDPTLNRSASKGAHGSSHTSFMMQSPFSSSSSAHQLYPSSIPSIPSEAPTASFSTPEILALPVSHNPLPAPPRDVTTKYWNYANANVATSH